MISMGYYPKLILRSISPIFIITDIFVEWKPWTRQITLKANLSDAINLTGSIIPLSERIVLIRYKKYGTNLNKNISYSARAKRVPKINNFVKQGDSISDKNSI